MRILRIELRRSAARWVALLVAAIGVFTLFASNPPYESWMEVVINQRDILQLTWPLMLGAGAWQGLRERRSGVEELLGTTSRPRRQRVLPVAAAMAIAAGFAYLAMFAGGVGHLRHLDSYFPAGAVPLIAVGALSLITAAWLGLAVGSLLPSPLTPPMLVVVGFVALALVPPIVFDQELGRPGTSLLFPSLQGPHSDGFRVLSGTANLAQAVWLAALAVAGLAVYAAARRRTRVAALAPVLLGAVIVVPAMPDRIAEAWVEDRRATEIVCTPEPRICTDRAHSHLLDVLRVPGAQALAILAAKLPPAPSSVLLWDGKSRPLPADALLVVIDLAGENGTGSPQAGRDDPAAGDGTGPDALLATMLAGAGTQPCENALGDAKPSAGQAHPADRYQAARLAVTLWLLDRDPGPGGDPVVELARDALAALHAVSLDEQRARVTAFREAERRCAGGDRLDLLIAAP